MGQDDAVRQLKPGAPKALYRERYLAPGARGHRQSVPLAPAEPRGASRSKRRATVFREARNVGSPGPGHGCTSGCPPASGTPGSAGTASLPCRRAWRPGCCLGAFESRRRDRRHQSCVHLSREPARVEAPMPTTSPFACSSGAPGSFDGHPPPGGRGAIDPGARPFLRRETLPRARSP